ncbi:TetR family transcriptional regulator [Parafilimonas sp.]|uniref:TetR family transcriptional regulator n=1 Tax=Parafilimonas sp. TaxID=1969739 RepID=UPI003F81DD4D
MGRKSLKEPRQKEIIEAFYNLAKTEGLENVSIAKTAEAININPSLVIHYFKTKEHLVYGLVEYILAKYLLIFKIPVRYQKDPAKKLKIVLDNLFSNKWNVLFDDSVSYSCYALTFRNDLIRKKYKSLLDTLRSNLEQIIIECNNASTLKIEDTAKTADWIFTLVDGAYYYLSLTDDKTEYQHKLNLYKSHVIKILGL